MTQKRYLVTPELRGEATVTAIQAAGDRVAIRLDRTYFHPQGGGQKADRGTIDNVPVVHVAHAPEGEIDHFLEASPPFTIGQTVSLQVDPAWRRRNTRLHTAGHLLAEVLPRRFPILKAVAGHHWPDEARVEFEALGEMPETESLLAALEAALAEAIAADWPVMIEANAEGYRTVQVGEGGLKIGCGGTHLARVGPLGAVAITGMRTRGQKLSVRYAVREE